MDLDLLCIITSTGDDLSLVCVVTATSTSAVQAAGPATTGVESSPLSTVDVQPSAATSAASGRQSAASAAVTVPRAPDGIQSTAVAATAGRLFYFLRCLNIVCVHFCIPFSWMYVLRS